MSSSQLTDQFAQLHIAEEPTSSLVLKFSFDNNDDLVETKLPQYTTPKLYTKFEEFRKQAGGRLQLDAASTELPPMADFWQSMKTTFGDTLTKAGVFSSDAAIKVVSRRRVFKEIWNYDSGQNDYYRKNYRCPVTVTRSTDGVLLFDVKRNSTISQSSKDTGLLFELMCTKSNQQGSSDNKNKKRTANFTAVFHKFQSAGVELLLVGEVDAEMPTTGELVEVKLTSAHPRFFDLLQKQQSDTKQWLACACRLALISKLVRGHRNKYNDKLDKLQVYDVNSQLPVEWSGLLERVKYIADRVQQTGTPFDVSYDDDEEQLKVTERV